MSIPLHGCRFKFNGSAGRRHNVTYQDRRLAKIVKRCQICPVNVCSSIEDEDGKDQTDRINRCQRIIEEILAIT